MEYLKLKINISIIKWLLFCALLLCNLIFLAPGNDILFEIIFAVSVNGLAILSLILLSYFPRLYYIFNDSGISYQNKKGKEYVFIPYESILEVGYVYIIGIRDGLEIVWTEGCVKRKLTLIISPKQAKEVYARVPAIKEIIDASN